MTPTAPFICIVDDAADYRLLIKQVFKHYLPAYPVQFFAGGKAFLDELPHMTRKPSLILLDRHMPDLDGHQTLLRLKEDVSYRKIPVVMMSADASRAEIDDCYDTFVNSFLIKQVEFDALKQTLSTICQYWLELNQQPTDQRMPGEK